MLNSKIKSRPVILALFGLIAAALVVAGCGSSGGSSSSGSASSSTGGETKTTPANEEGAEAGEAVASMEYAPGVPTLEEMYEGNEEPPPSSGPKPKEGISIVFVSCGQEAPGCANVPDAMEEPAKKLGWNFRIINGKLDVNNGWPNGVREAVAAKPDVIIVHGMNCPEIEQPLKEAKAAGIPVMGLEDVDCNDKYVGGGEPLFSIPIKFAKGEENGEEFFDLWGKLSADYVIDASKGEGKIIQTLYETPFGKHQLQGQEEELKKCSGCEVVATLPFTANEETPNGPVYQKYTTLLTQNPEANASLFNFDSLGATAGLSKAIVDAGRAEEMVVGAGEGSKPILQLMEEGNKGWTGETAFDAKRIAWGAIDEINRYLNNQPPVLEGAGFRLVTKGNNMPPAGHEYESPTKYKPIYEKSWGLG
jgi:ribose transport system substrate-binding protein